MGDLGAFGRESVVTRFGAEEEGEPGRRGRKRKLPSGHAEKYSVDTLIAMGGMGEVLLVTDQDLRRHVAMKVMRRDHAIVESHRLRFVAEAQATAQLEHPGIPPVHDIGTTPEGAPWFTMKLVRGRTLRQVLQDLLLNRMEVRKEFSLHRLVTVLERICEAVHFAHEKGVLHRDLKPENIMLGDYGEVHVMDWGIARVRGEEVDPADQVDTEATDARLMTMAGQTKGTAEYMSPEQAQGQVSAMDRRSDVWALGCLLYEMLTLHLAFDGEKPLARVKEGKYPPVRRRSPKRPVPEALALLCDRCLRVDPEERPPSAKALAEALRAWLDGTAERERKHREAEDLAAKGREAAARYEELKREVLAAEDAAEAAGATFQGWMTEEEKRPILEKRQAAESKREEVALAFAATTRLLEAALVAEAENATARAALADLWRGRLAESERELHRPDASHALNMLRRYDDGRLRRVVGGDGSLMLTSEPAGADVVIHRYEDRLGVLVEGEGRSLGRTPTGIRELSMGSYLCRLRLPGHREVRYPIHIARNRSWTGHVRMRTDEEIGEGFVYVPAGPFVYGEGRDSRILELPDFAIARFPVTFGEWADFLRAVEAEKGAEAAKELIPYTSGDGPQMERTGPGEYLPLPVVVEGPARERCLREHGPDFLLRSPVVGVSWHVAAPYFEWRARTTGKEWRLPTEEEREKAARGVDGRSFPWGEREDAGLGKCRDSRNEASQEEPVGTFATAASVYGAADMAGNVWDWTGTWFDAQRSARVVRGGSWNYTVSSLRCANRRWNQPGDRNGNNSFRAARSFPA